MFKQFAQLFLAGILATFLVACGGQSTTADGAIVPTELPTSTPAIADTPLPPPTVTPFPPVTPRSVEVAEDEDESDAENEAGDEDDSSDEAEPEGEDSEPAEEPAADPIVAPVPVGTVLYETNFARGWPDVDEDSAQITTQSSRYLFELGPFDARFFTTNGIGAGNTYTQVEVTPTNCPPQAGYGLVFRFQDTSGYYLFTLFCSGTYSAIARVDGRPASGGATGDLSIDAAENTTRTLGVLADGSAFTLYVDGDELDSFSDNRFEAGDVGVYAISQSGEIIEVSFSNLRVFDLP